MPLAVGLDATGAEGVQDLLDEAGQDRMRGFEVLEAAFEALVQRPRIGWRGIRQRRLHVALQVIQVLALAVVGGLGALELGVKFFEMVTQGVGVVGHTVDTSLDYFWLGHYTL